jgi:nicotinate-nucleotide pyrophosphorylase (carboxylating)
MWRATMAQHIDQEYLRTMWQRALAEDGVKHDVTCQIALDEHAAGTAHVRARQPGVLAGRAVLDLIADLYAGRLVVEPKLDDGERMGAGTLIATLAGPLHLLLGIERTLLNFLERLCGVATLTRRFVDAVEGTRAKVYDTRKTIPAWRKLDKYAVHCGGGLNHRLGLHDAVLVKDNHLAGVPLDELAATVHNMMKRIASLDRRPDCVEFEVDTLEQLDEILKVVGIDVVLLDNFTPEQMREAVRRRAAAGLAGRLALEASGNVTLQNVREVAATGVERIAVGAITHSAPALDIGMDIEPGK